MWRSLTTAEMVRLQSDSGRTARKRIKSITEIEKLGQSSQRRFYLIASGRDRLQQRAEIVWVLVRQTLDGHWHQLRPLVHSWGGSRHASRVATDVLGVAASAWSVLFGLMLVGQQSRPRPGATVRWRRGN